MGTYSLNVITACAQVIPKGHEKVRQGYVQNCPEARNFACFQQYTTTAKLAFEVAINWEQKEKELELHGMEKLQTQRSSHVAVEQRREHDKADHGEGNDEYDEKP